MNRLTPDDVRRVVQLDAEPVLRNLLITQGYHDASQMLRERTGQRDMNWCTLGTWASKTAGQFIRNDELPGAFRKLLANSGLLAKIAHALDPLHVLDLVQEIVADVSGYIMMGNRVVFEELAQVFADFMAELGADQTPDPVRLRRFQDTLSDGEPAPDRADWDAERKRLIVTRMGGQGELRKMVAAYYAAMFESDEKKRAELLLLGNARGGIHEQTRLQTYIAGSLDAPIADTLMVKAHARVDATVEHSITRKAAHLVIDQLLPAIARHIEGAWEEFATVGMMTLTLPDGVIHLGNPLAAETGEPLFPPALKTIDNPELRGLLAQFDAVDVKIVKSTWEKIKERFARLLGLGHPEQSLLEIGAHDWVDYKQRMRFILVLFRSRADDQHLWNPPFNEAQLEALRAGRLPTGPL